MSNKLHDGFLPMSPNVTQNGTINCSSAAPAISTDPETALFISFTNPGQEPVEYAVYNNATGTAVSKGTIPGGDSKQVVVDAQPTPLTVRIQNQSPCDAGGITPQLSYSASTQS